MSDFVRNDIYALSASSGAERKTTRDKIFDILSYQLPYDVYKSKVDPLADAYDITSVSINTRNVSRKLLTSQLDYEVNEIVDIYVVLAKNEDYDVDLDTVIELTLALLLSNAEFVASFEQISSINTVYEYAASGETNTAKARIEMTFEYTEFFEPNITALLQSLHIDTDVISPAADPNLLPPGETLGPDGRIELNSDILLEQP